MRLLLLSFLIGLCTTTTRAQTPLLGGGGDPVPDTTTGWRYAPIEIGNAWEYEDSINSLRRRIDVLRDTLVHGRHHFIVRDATYDLDGTPRTEREHPIRYDTTTSFVLGEADYMGQPLIYTDRFGFCPLNAQFDDVVDCSLNGDGNYYQTSGGYDGLLVFDTGSEPDTLRNLSYKQYDGTIPVIHVADFGLVALYADGVAELLRYARINGMEYGIPRFSVAVEPTPQETTPFVVWPNPVRGRVNIGLPLLIGAGPSILTVYDALGRRQYAAVIGARGEVQVLDVSGWAAGTYVVVLTTQGTRHRTMFTVLRR